MFAKILKKKMSDKKSLKISRKFPEFVEKTVLIREIVLFLVSKNRTN